MYCYKHSVDITCGASNAMNRILARPLPPGVQPRPEEPMQEDTTLKDRDLVDLLDPELMPQRVISLGQEGAATCGFVYARGHIRLWANDKCAADYFSTEEANARFAQMGVLPCFLFGWCVRACVSPDVVLVDGLIG